MIRRMIATMAAVVLLSQGPVDARKFAGPLDALQPGEWYRVPNSHMKDLDPDPSRTSSYRGAEGQYAVMNDWCGGAFDTFRDRLIAWGGGHGGYAGNEIYVFDLNTLAWQRVSNPSDPPAVDVPYAADGGPCSRHTYNYVQYMPSPVDRFCSFGGAGFYSSGQTGTHHLDCFNFGTGRWETQKFADTPAGNLIGSITAVDPSTGRVWQHGGSQSWISDFNPATNTWTSHNDQFNGTYLDYYKTADIDPTRKKMVAVGNGEVWTWDISLSGTIPGVKQATTGATEILSSNSPGFAYVASVDKFVAWKSGADVYTLDPATWVWTKRPPAATNTVTPTAPNGNGTFGRFRYSPTKNVFVLVNKVEEDVYIYKLSPGAGSPPPAPPPPAPPPPAPPPAPGPAPGGSPGGSGSPDHQRCGCGTAPNLGGGWLALASALALAFALRR